MHRFEDRKSIYYGRKLYVGRKEPHPKLKSVTAAVTYVRGIAGFLLGDDVPWSIIFTMSGVYRFQTTIQGGGDYF